MGRSVENKADLDHPVLAVDPQQAGMADSAPRRFFNDSEEQGIGRSGASFNIAAEAA